MGRRHFRESIDISDPSQVDPPRPDWVDVISQNQASEVVAPIPVDAVTEEDAPTPAVSKKAMGKKKRRAKPKE